MALPAFAPGVEMSIEMINEELDRHKHKEFTLNDAEGRLMVDKTQANTTISFRDFYGESKRGEIDFSGHPWTIVNHDWSYKIRSNDVNLGKSNWTSHIKDRKNFTGTVTVKQYIELKGSAVEPHGTSYARIEVLNDNTLVAAHERRNMHGTETTNIIANFVNVDLDKIVVRVMTGGYRHSYNDGIGGGYIRQAKIQLYGSSITVEGMADV